MQRSLRRIKHRIKRLVTSYMSPLGWAVTGLTIASLITFTILGWHELLAMAIVFACMMVAALLRAWCSPPPCCPSATRHSPPP